MVINELIVYFLKLSVNVENSTKLAIKPVYPVQRAPTRTQWGMRQMLVQLVRQIGQLWEQDRSQMLIAQKVSLTLYHTIPTFNNPEEEAL